MRPDDQGEEDPFPRVEIDASSSVSRGDWLLLRRPVTQERRRSVAVYAVDAGTVRRTRKTLAEDFAWARVQTARSGVVIQSMDPERLVESLLEDVSAGIPIALGFEVPLYLPVPTTAAYLCKGRGHDGVLGPADRREGNRSCFAGASATITPMALPRSFWHGSRSERRTCGRPPTGADGAQRLTSC